MRLVPNIHLLKETTEFSFISKFILSGADECQLTIQNFYVLLKKIPEV